MREKRIHALKDIPGLTAVIAAAAIIPVSATAAEQNDSTSKQLQEVVVEGRNTYTTRHGVTYVTNRNQRNGAANAYDLLGRLGMTEIQVDPRTNEVTTNSGQPVDYFVNGQPAKPGEVEGLWPAEIRKVEYLEAPSDPRFMGKQYVINYIVDVIISTAATRAYPPCSIPGSPSADTTTTRTSTPRWCTGR